MAGNAVSNEDLESIRRVVFESLVPKSFAGQEVMFLEVEHGEDPSDELLVYFVRSLLGKVSVRPVSAMRRGYSVFAAERGSGRQGFCLTIKQITPLSNDHFQVRASEYSGSLAGAGFDITVVRDSTGWRVMQMRLTWMS